MRQLSLLVLALAFMTSSSSLRAEPITVGQPAPDLEVLDQDGKALKLGDVYKKGITVVYFYPKADTPGCTAQACSLRDGFAELTGKGVTVLGASTDTPAAQKAFQEKYHLPFTLIADSDGKLATAFGVPVNGGHAQRQTFLVKDGKVVWLNLKAPTGEQAAEILKVLPTL